MGKGGGCAERHAGKAQATQQTWRIPTEFLAAVFHCCDCRLWSDETRVLHRGCHLLAPLPTNTRGSISFECHLAARAHLHAGTRAFRITTRIEHVCVRSTGLEACGSWIRQPWAHVITRLRCDALCWAQRVVLRATVALPAWLTAKYRADGADAYKAAMDVLQASPHPVTHTVCATTMRMHCNLAYSGPPFFPKG